jgi:hypothetical protein
VGGTVDHPLSDQPGTPGCNAFHLNTELRCDVSRAMRSGTELGHRPEITRLRRGHTIYPNQKDTLVEFAPDQRSGGLDIVAGDR